MKGGNPTTIARGVKGTASTRTAVHFVPNADPQLANPSNYAIQQNEITVRDNTDSEWALKLDFDYEPAGSAFDAIKFGAYLGQREKSFDTSRGRSGPGEGRDNPVLATAVANSTMRAPGNFLASNGNPGLLPYLADASLEWYFNQASALTATVFLKRVGDFITDSTARNVEIAGVTWAEVKRPENQGEAEILGFELGYSHAFTELPAPFNGLGLIVNMTSVDSELTLKTGAEVTFPGVSDMSVNSTVYCDRGAIQARLAYSWRDDFLFDPAGIWNNRLYVDAYGQWDFSTSYDTTEHVAVFVDVINLSDERELMLSDWPAPLAAGQSRPLSLGQVGRRIGFGLRATF